MDAPSHDDAGVPVTAAASPPLHASTSDVDANAAANADVNPTGQGAGQGRRPETEAPGVSPRSPGGNQPGDGNGGNGGNGGDGDGGNGDGDGDGGNGGNNGGDGDGNNDGDGEDDGWNVNVEATSRVAVVMDVKAEGALHGHAAAAFVPTTLREGGEGGEGRPPADGVPVDVVGDTFDRLMSSTAFTAAKDPRGNSPGVPAGPGDDELLEPRKPGWDAYNNSKEAASAKKRRRVSTDPRVRDYMHNVRTVPRCTKQARATRGQCQGHKAAFLPFFFPLSVLVAHGGGPATRAQLLS